MRKAVEYAYDGRLELEEGYQLHFYTLYLLGQFQDREFFPKIMELVSMPEDELEFLIRYAICRSHFVDMLPEIRYMFDQDILDEMIMGKYDSYVDAVFEYRESWEKFCQTSIYAADLLWRCAMF